LKAYTTAPQFANTYAKTADFVTFANTFTGENLTEFFNDWVYGEGYPTYTVRWKPGTTNVTFKISQTQSHNSVNYYEMPLPVKVVGANGQSMDLVLNNTSNNQYFTNEVGFPVTAVYFNQDLHILTKNSTVVKDNSLAVDDLKSLKVMVYPNPATTEIIISNLKKDTAYQIFSIDGRLIKSGNLDSNKTINILNLEKGEYILKTNDDQIKFLKH